ncbi:phosphatidylinositol glycan anchor biosynthesis [Capsaspora owczarzaki ATCC 30864]|uniref:N-acetylglucosaminylphosphatidylinositol deacetylase n=1 Tax=Capsaspora owczarzaki (strain ATCC 30864) TaxID=595528 RepID=A0A0D2WLE7_CAPO3|nr:phosphatidylinositol glycan anchor biosynthesis [Capsaspora owczarzaki ATCC 30864]KJE90643.1 phosphatidylinositol glycan anchor biosynthesis [Capsaspora owczarzaki ATCC 30864]|eukprot:XP_004364789.1 phosphatidylinositol glycan anchor biosynthesis [Capsaspora owczarzaki ATCC 30864]
MPWLGTRFDGKRTLLITAHPDDECMFFGPGVTCLLAKSEMFVLCLSTGNADGLGSVRARELVGACTALGLPASHVSVVDREDAFADGQANLWRASHVADCITEHVARWKIDTLLTFDAHGVSGHANHIAVWHGACVCLDREEQVGTAAGCLTLWSLQSKPLWRKYMIPIDLALSWWEVYDETTSRSAASPSAAARSNGGLAMALSTPRQIRTTWRAMLQHRSQLVWFRWLYLLFASFMLLNTLVRRQPPRS